IGENVRKHPEIYRQILKEGHRTGNHTQHHINGWKTSKINYLRQSLLCSQYVQSDLFRPPYGRISRTQAKALKSRFRIIMWDVLSMDYDKTISREKCLVNVVKNAGPGSIIVFHDSLKAADKMLYALPAMLDHFSKKGFLFNAIP
ncbi:MAG: polysaccharide deacetylase family protein, partial [Flavobacteriales bacterium]